ncbi:MAG: hypothetical protein HY791_31840 [Deltaproteobacteria bacterium]|nr:hypothetical protein [Deltaproteobacteria bacterium]
MTTELDQELQRIRAERNILPPMFYCPHCKRRERGAPTHISVRALLLAVARNGIDDEDAIAAMERDWKRFRAQNGLDVYGKKAAASVEDDPPTHSPPTSSS